MPAQKTGYKGKQNLSEMTVPLSSPVVAIDSRSSTPEMPPRLPAIATAAKEQLLLQTDREGGTRSTNTKKNRNYWKWDSPFGILRCLTILTALLDLRTNDDQVSLFPCQLHTALPHILTSLNLTQSIFETKGQANKDDLYDQVIENLSDRCEVWENKKYKCAAIRN
jgi:hypothetical protein